MVVDEKDKGEILSFHPNPAVNVLNISVETRGKYTKFNSLKKSVLKNIKLENGDNQISLNIETGLYFMVFKSKSCTSSRKLIIE